MAKRIEIGNRTYDVIARLSRYYVPLAAGIHIFVCYTFEFKHYLEILIGFVYLQLLLGIILWVVRSRWKAKDTLIIDDRNEDETYFGFESGRRFTDLKHNKIMTLRIRKLSCDSAPKT